MDKYWFENAHAIMEQMVVVENVKNILSNVLFDANENDDIILELSYNSACDLYDYLAYGE